MQLHFRTAAIQPDTEDTVSLAQLVQVKLNGDSADLTRIDLKTTEKPAEDFMAVLDRALADRNRTEDSRESASPRSDFETQRPSPVAETRQRAPPEPGCVTIASPPCLLIVVLIS